MDAYSSSQFSRISYMFLLLIFLSMIFHDVLLLLSRMFYLVPQYSFAYSADLFLSIYVSPHTCTYSLLLICTIYTLNLLCLESLAPRPNLPSPLVNLVAPELTKLLIISISLHPTLKGSLLLYLNHLWRSHNNNLTSLRWRYMNKKTNTRSQVRTYCRIIFLSIHPTSLCSTMKDFC